MKLYILKASHNDNHVKNSNQLLCVKFLLQFYDSSHNVFHVFHLEHWDHRS